MTTVNQEEIQKFSKLADQWWDANGKFKPLHTFNPIRIKYIIDKCSSHFKLNKQENKTLSKLKILDIGCGGGLVCEPLTRLGAQVTGIDASYKNIEVAKIHAKKSNLKIKYLNASPEKNKINEKFDVILNLEVVEHVDNLDLFLKSSSELLKKNGIMFIATINRTFESYIKAIIGAEYVLRWLPIGTHDWQKFLKPEEIEKKFKQLNLDKTDLNGLKFNIFSNNWSLSSDCSVNYIIVAKKN
jgi:2-polyprenyl-6-hydroxyphenyl methylase/3-demethylubiquinone-9 3-methyltransferase|tara:strand:- start:1097 stop:1822 length:726 start_codon:yes stop_codon:yes gene_type:complete